MMEVLIAILLVAVLFGIWRLSRSQANPDAMINDLQRREKEALNEAQRLRDELEKARLGEQKAIVQAENLAKSLEESRRYMENLQSIFKASAGEAMSASTQDFLKLAEETLKGISTKMLGDLDLRAGSVASMVKPLSEQVEQLRRSSEELGKAQKGGEEGIRQLMQSMGAGQEKLRQETAALAKAMSNNQVRGQWGEMVIERLLQLSGLSAPAQYERQASAAGGGRPDFIIHLPGHRDIIVDSKAILGSYLQASQEEDLEKRRILLEQHAKDLRTTVDALSKKDYIAQFAQAPDFVVLFLPADVALQAALEQDPELFEHAFLKKIVLATPSSFMAMLKIIERTWQESRMAENAREISKQGQVLMDRLLVFSEHLGKMGRELERSVKTYNEMNGSLTSKVYPAVKKLRDLDVKAGREMDDAKRPQAIEESPRYKELETSTQALLLENGTES